MVLKINFYFPFSPLGVGGLFRGLLQLSVSRYRHLALEYPLPQNSIYVNLGDWIRFDSYAVFDGGELALKTDALVDNHCGDAETALKVIGAMLTYNFQTLGKLTSGGFLESVTAKIPDIARKLLTQLQPVLSEKGKQRSKK